mgnify:CR=1
MSSDYDIYIYILPTHNPAEGAALGAWVVWLPQPWLHTIAEAQLPLLCCAMAKRLRRGESEGDQ